MDYLVEFAVGIFGNVLRLLELTFQEGQPLLICKAAAFQGLAVSEDDRLQWLLRQGLFSISKYITRRR